MSLNDPGIIAIITVVGGGIFAILAGVAQGVAGSWARYRFEIKQQQLLLRQELKSSHRPEQAIEYREVNSEVKILNHSLLSTFLNWRSLISLLYLLGVLAYGIYRSSVWYTMIGSIGLGFSIGIIIATNAINQLTRTSQQMIPLIQEILDGWNEAWQITDEAMNDAKKSAQVTSEAIKTAEEYSQQVASATDSMRHMAEVADQANKTTKISLKKIDEIELVTERAITLLEELLRDRDMGPTKIKAIIKELKSLE
ncbi:hypothetical protein [Aggregatilinea lenta]|uniref:hypothetical protein n=1 Tax=Aggregatilinea lenta TaxID=913108 RepID=UPI0013C2A055|nr:hypothetical protein [Aggregatilinea lenta]